MLSNKEFIGLDLREDSINVAHIRVDSGKIKLVKLDKFSLVEKITTKTVANPDVFSTSEEVYEEELDADSIFGLDDELDEGESESEVEITDEDLNFDDLEDEVEEEEEDLMSLDMVEETDTVQSNQMLLYNILTGIARSKLSVGLNIRAGSAIFQIIRDTDFNEVKKKDLVQDLEEKLQSIYGVTKSSDYYNYEVREDGSLVLASIESDPPLLELFDRVLEMYNGKVTIEEILPDEVALVGMIRANYNLQPNEITGVLQFGKKTSRIIFLRGSEIWQISPIINEGTDNKSFLNTVFSKILFQLDTGEVPNLDRIILANNSLGEEAVEFFRQNFSDLSVSNFEFNDEKFEYGNIEPEIATSFTTTIATAWAASGSDSGAFPKLSLLPQYVLERQKIFKLQWHGVMLLLLIFLSPVTINYFYQQNAAKISRLNTELQQINAQITRITPIAESTTETMGELEQLKEKLVLLDTLSQGSREWSAKLNIINKGLQRIRSSWLTSMNKTSDGTFIQGYTLYRNRIPLIVNLFKDATLLNVTIQEVREQEVFEFSIVAKEFAKDPSVYSPPKPEDLQEILNN